MPHYIGYWLECQNRKCGFPIRIPYSPAARSSGEAPFLFACPVCLAVKTYKKRDLQEVRFRSPDPYRAGKAVLYSARLGCAQPRCSGEAIVLTVAASNVSVERLLQFWRAWKLDQRCNDKHRLRLGDPNTWWIEEEKSLS